MNRTEKMAQATELGKKFGASTLAVFADYKGLSAPDADELRKQLRAHKTEVRVIKNNVARLLKKDSGIPESLKTLLDETVGPTLVAFAYDDPAVCAKIVHQFCQKYEALELKDSVMGSQRLSVSEVEALAQLPSLDVMRAQFLGTLNAPAEGFVRVLAGVPRGILTLLKNVQEKREEE